MEELTDVVGRLATSLGRKDEVPNQELATEIILKKDSKAIQQLIDLLENGTKAIQHDCIKVLYEVGEKEPSLIANYLSVFLTLLGSKNNRLQWGGMIAISTLSVQKADEIYDNIPYLLEVGQKGSVISRDNVMNVLIKLSQSAKYEKEIIPLIIEQLLLSPTNQLAMYAERTLPIIKTWCKELFIKTLTTRLSEIEKASKRVRIEKVIKKANNIV